MSLFESASLVVTPNGTKASKLYAIKPTDGSGDLTVTRATTATRVNASGLISSVANNVPRLDYTNSTCPSILVEPQRTNTTQRSEDFSNGYWVKANSDITSNSVIAPDGVLSADTFSDRVLTNQTYVLTRNESYISGTTYTSSFFAKNLDRRYVYMRFVSGVFGTNKYVFFDLQLGTIISVASGVTAEIINYGNGWFRCIATSTASSTTTTTNGVVIGLSDNGVNVSYTNPSVKSIYIWGAQLEAGSYDTSYIPTTTASVTRNADVISKTGISSLIGTTYTVYGEIINEGIHNARHLVLKLPTGGNYADVVFIVQYFNGLQATANNSTSTAQFTINSGSYSIGQTLKYALRCEQNNVAFYINGVQIGVDTLCTIPAVSTLYIGNYVDLQLGSKIKSTMIFPSALTNTELQSLTTL